MRLQRLRAANKKMKCEVKSSTKIMQKFLIRRFIVLFIIWRIIVFDCILKSRFMDC